MKDQLLIPLSMDSYVLNHKKRCKPVIIRASTDPHHVTDVETLTSLFEMFCFDAPHTEFRNLSRKNLLEGLLALAARPEYTSDVDFLLCVILGHGTECCFKDKDENYVSVDDVIHIFNNEACVGLRGKPKIFIVQTDDETIGLSEPGHFGGPPENEVYTIPEMADIFVYHSSIPGRIENYDWEKSAFDKSKGSIFIYELCDILNRDPNIEIHQLTLSLNGKLNKYLEGFKTRKLRKTITGSSKELNKLPVLPVCTSQLRKEFTFFTNKQETAV